MDITIPNMYEEKVERLMDVIVRTYFSDEIPVYEMERDTLFAKAWAHEFSFSETNEFGGINQAGGQVQEILGCIATLLGTVKAVFEIMKLRSKGSTAQKKNVPIELLTEKWLAELQLAGLDRRLAQSLSTRFINDLENALDNE